MEASTGDAAPPPGTARTAGPRPAGMTEKDEQFIRAVYAEHGAALLRHALKLTGGDRQRAEDIVQETVFRAWRNPEDVSGPKARPWLLRVASNLSVDLYRRRRSRPPEVGDEHIERLPDSGDYTDRVLEASVIADALASLTADHRRVIVECYYRDMSVAAVAELLGIPPGTVKSRLYYGLKALRLALQERGMTP